MRFTTMLALMSLSVSATATAQQASTPTLKDSDLKPLTVETFVPKARVY